MTETTTWRLGFTVPRHLVPAFEEALGEAPDAILATPLAPGAFWRLEALFQLEPELGFWRRRLDRVAAAEGLAPLALDLAALPERDWVAASLRGLAPVRAGRILIHGRHDAGAVPPGVYGLEIEAGRAFGTGQHETTLGCLLALDYLRRRRSYRRILDLGCGSGVLALAAARLWPCRVIASDIDPQAVRSARANAKTNGLGARVEVVRAEGLRHPRLRAVAPYDLIMANILARPLARLAKDLARVAAPGAVVVLSGLLTKQERQVLQPYRSLGFVLARRLSRGDWPTLVLRRGRTRVL